MQPRCVRILLSGALDLQIVVRGLNRGDVEHVLQKPCSRKLLLAAIDEAVAARLRMEQSYSDNREERQERERRQIEQCVAGGHLTLALQPVLHADHGGLYGYEALLRSSHQILDAPLAVIAAAELHGMLGRVADVVLSQVECLLPALPAPLLLFVNLHPGELRAAGEVRERFARLRPWAHRIVIEITERCELPAMSEWRSTLDELIADGFRIAVDDLGAGYNSLAALAEIRPDFVKIDMSIVRGIDQHERKQRLVELLCRFSRATGTLVVVEGIETQAEAATLRALGADFMQGFLLGRPEPAAHILGLRSSSSASAR